MEDVYFAILAMLAGLNLFGLVVLGVLIGKIRDLVEEVLRWI